jgi:WXG100 family type VII secretion target
MEIKMNYEMMDEMKQAFQKGAEDLDNTISQLGKINDMLQNGGLIGVGGEAFSAALTDVLVPKVTNLRDKFEELARDIQAAVNSMREADKNSSDVMGS